jgi:hypothetical protein
MTPIDRNGISRVQRGKEQGRVQGNPTSNSGKEKEPLGR